MVLSLGRGLPERVMLLQVLQMLDQWEGLSALGSEEPGRGSV